MGAILGFLKFIPLKVWLALAIVAAVAFAIWRVYSTGLEEGAARKDAEWSEKWTARETAWKALAAREEARYASEKAKVEDDARKAIAILQARLDAARELAKRARQDLEIARSRYVSAKADAACVVPVGFVMFHNRAAAIASGQPGASGAPEPGPSIADAPSGTTLSTVAAVNADNLLALGECRTQVLGWQEHWKFTERWHAQVAAALTTGGTP